MNQPTDIAPALRRRLIEAQRNEITEYHVYRRLARRQKDEHNREVLLRIADDEKKHYEFWAEYTGAHPRPRRRQIAGFTLLARLLGLTFAVRLMERGEEGAQVDYSDLAETIPDARQVVADESAHEDELTAMIDEAALRYVGSVVLGLSDALVELTGALAGFTLALRDPQLIALIGTITGVAAAMSMAASEYLSTRHDEAQGGDGKNPVRAAVYTGGAYVLVVGVLIAPFLLLTAPLAALGLTLAAALGVILAFTYYISVARDQPLWPRFAEMAGLSLGVAAVSFGIGYLLRVATGIEA